MCNEIKGATCRAEIEKTAKEICFSFFLEKIEFREIPEGPLNTTKNKSLLPLYLFLNFVIWVNFWCFSKHQGLLLYVFPFCGLFFLNGNLKIANDCFSISINPMQASLWKLLMCPSKAPCARKWQFILIFFKEVLVESVSKKQFETERNKKRMKKL